MQVRVWRISDRAKLYLGSVCGSIGLEKERKTMADTAAFFAKKKKGGKKFKSFNANKIDVSQVTSTVHM